MREDVVTISTTLILTTRGGGEGKCLCSLYEAEKGGKLLLNFDMEAGIYKNMYPMNICVWVEKVAGELMAAAAADKPKPKERRKGKRRAK